MYTRHHNIFFCGENNNLVIKHNKFQYIAAAKKLDVYGQYITTPTMLDIIKTVDLLDNGAFKP